MENYNMYVDKITGAIKLVCTVCGNSLVLDLTQDWIGGSDRVKITHKCPKENLNRTYNPIDLS